MLHVAVLSDFPLDPSVVTGGVAGVAVSLVSGLAGSSNVRVTVISCYAGRNLIRKRWMDADLIYVPSERKRELLTLFAADRRMISNVLSDVRPDVVHAQGTSKYAYIALSTRFPVVITPHGDIVRDSRMNSRGLAQLRTPLLALLQNAVMSRAKNVISITDYVKTFARPSKNARVYSIPNPVDPAFFESRGESPHSGVILVPARVLPVKGLHKLPLILSRLGHLGLRATIRVAGQIDDTVYHDEIVATAKRQGVSDQLIFLGQLGQPELLDQYADSALVLLPSQHEVSPLAVQQAMAFGRTVVASSVGGIPSIVQDGVSGYVVNKDDVSTFADRLSHLLTNHELRRQFEGSGKQAASGFHPSLVARDTIDAYLETITRHGRG